MGSTYCLGHDAFGSILHSRLSVATGACATCGSDPEDQDQHPTPTFRPSDLERLFRGGRP